MMGYDHKKLPFLTAQQSFSSDCGPATHLALPALEALHKAWYTHSTKQEYIDFWPVLKVGLQKVANYYEKTADSDAYIMVMCAYISNQLFQLLCY